MEAARRSEMKIARRSTEVEKSLICQGSALFTAAVIALHINNSEAKSGSTKVASKNSVGTHLVGRSLRRWLSPASTPDKTPMSP